MMAFCPVCMCMYIINTIKKTEKRKDWRKVGIPGPVGSPLVPLLNHAEQLWGWWYRFKSFINCPEQNLHPYKIRFFFFVLRFLCFNKKGFTQKGYSPILFEEFKPVEICCDLAIFVSRRVETKQSVRLHSWVTTPPVTLNKCEI
uniref:Uncharacterized protein n=1 Tax=Timema tahoe TaxID=61484 RepID=A0A7R9IAJ4_9NEOP|nr:unnamed protein product [Timema tahoe]